VIKDVKTGDSLQYAFVEFDNSDSAEEAYFKMDNALIDDRRIHVDFSQSVSKANFKVPKKYGGGGGALPRNMAIKGAVYGALGFELTTKRSM
jgi:peptidyl-prolyl cis-trans isomerase-like 4